MSIRVKMYLRNILILGGAALMATGKGVFLGNDLRFIFVLLGLLLVSLGLVWWYNDHFKIK